MGALLQIRRRYFNKSSLEFPCTVIPTLEIPELPTLLTFMAARGEGVQRTESERAGK